MVNRHASPAPGASRSRKAKFFGQLVRGAHPAIGGSRKDGHAMSGTSQCKQKPELPSIVWFAIYSVESGRSREPTISIDLRHPARLLQDGFTVLANWILHAKCRPVRRASRPFRF